MPTFIVSTWETVEGTYRVEAENQEAAEAKFKRPGLIDWEAVVQEDYQAFDIEIRGCNPCASVRSIGC